MKDSAKRLPKFIKTLIIFSLIVMLFRIWNATRPSQQNTIHFLIQHQELLDEYVTLSRSHSPDAEAVLAQIGSYHYFTSVDCFFDQNGAIEVHFSVPERGRKIDSEGYYYQTCYCLLWQDSDYHGSPLLFYWSTLGVKDDLTIPQGGSWYWTSHKHYLYG